MTELSNPHREHQESTTPFQRLRWPESVRIRPHMYVGSIDELGLLCMVSTLVDNSLDEVVRGEASQIEVVIDPDGVVMVRDNGRGISVDWHPDAHKPILEWLLTDPAAEYPPYDDGYKMTSAGVSIGLACVNALSERMRIEVHRNGKVYRQEYQRGVANGPIEVLDADPILRGTTVYFKADPLIFGTLEHDADLLRGYFHELCYLVRGLRIHFEDQRPGKSQMSTFYFSDGIRSWVRHLSRQQLNLLLPQPFYVAANREQASIEIAMQYCWGGTEQMLAFVNGGLTIHGGTHVKGFLAGLSEPLNRYARTQKILKTKEPDLTEEDVREDLCAIINVNVTHPRFNATGTVLYNAEVAPLVQSILSEAWQTFLEENPKIASRIVENCRDNAQRRRTARRASRK